MVCLKWLKAAMFMCKDVNLTGLLGGQKEDWGSGEWKSISGVQGQSRARVGSLGDEEAEAFIVKLHIIFALKYNKQQLLLLLDKIHLP